MCNPNAVCTCGGKGDENCEACNPICKCGKIIDEE